MIISALIESQRNANNIPAQVALPYGIKLGNGEFYRGWLNTGGNKALIVMAGATVLNIIIGSSRLFVPLTVFSIIVTAVMIVGDLYLRRQTYQLIMAQLAEVKTQLPHAIQVKDMAKANELLNKFFALHDVKLIYQYHRELHKLLETAHLSKLKAFQQIDKQLTKIRDNQTQKMHSFNPSGILSACTDYEKTLRKCTAILDGLAYITVLNKKLPTPHSHIY